MRTLLANLPSSICCLVMAGSATGLLANQEEGTAGGHVGPGIAPGPGGPARFVEAVYKSFDKDSAMETVALADRFYRAPGNLGYNATLDRVRSRLELAGFGELDGFELEEIETEMRAPAWTPKSASLEAVTPDGETIRLHAFKASGDMDRVMLPVNAPSADVEGRVVFDEAEVREGTILVTDKSVRDRRIAQLAKQGARAVISSSIASFTRDPSGGDEHLDAIQFRTVSRSVRLPVAQISPRSHSKLEALVGQHGEIRLHLRAEVEFTEGKLRTLVARVVGTTRPDEVVVVASHVQEPGAGDNASGVGGLCAGVVGLAEAMKSGSIQRPARTLDFIWGDEMRQSSIWLEQNERQVTAAVSADMLGQSATRTGAICLLEREPDPGALDTLPPDKHTPWGKGAVKEEDLRPSGLSLIARMTLHDVGLHVAGWNTSENPWEGGSDHDIFLDRGIPGILIWHFTDFTYHTSLDRLDRIDAEELRRSVTTIMALGLTIADLRQTDLKRLRTSNELERELRVKAALDAGRPDVAKRWREWCHGVEQWLAASCTDLERD